MNIKQIDLEDVLDFSHLEQLLNNFSAASGLATSLVDTQSGEILISSGWRELCGNFNYADRKAQQGCRKVISTITTDSSLTEQIQIHQCENGLINGYTPLIFQDRPFAYLVAGQVFLDQPNIELLKNQAQMYDFDESSYLAHAAEIPVVERERFNSMLLCLADTAALLIQSGMARLTAIQDVADKNSLLRNLFNTAPAGICYVTDRIMQQTNPQMSKITGYSNAELNGQSARMLYADDETFTQVGQMRQLRFDADGTFSFTTTWQKKDGSPLDVHLQLTFLDKSDPAKGEIVTILDISELKKVERDLKLSETRLKEAQEVAQIGNWEFNIPTQNLYWSDETYRIFATDPGKTEALYTFFRNSIHPDDRERVKKAYSAHIENNLPYDIEHRVLLQDGTLKHVHERCRTEYDNHHNPIRSIGTVQDISKRKSAERILERERELFTQGPVLTITWSPAENWPILYVSPNVADIFGYTPKEMTAPGFHYAALIHPDDLERVRAEAQQLLTDKTKHSLEQHYRLRTKTGQYKWAYDSTIVERDIDGHARAIRGYILDQTELKEAELLLQQERQRLAYILEGTHVGTWEWNVQTGETQFNERWAEIIGYTLEELAPVSIDTWVKYSHPDDFELSKKLLQDHFSGKLNYYECEARMKHKNGDWIWVLDRGQVAKWSDDGKPLLMFGTHQDITSRKTAEQQMQISHQELEKRVDERTAALKDSNLRMQQEIRERMASEHALYQSEMILEKERATLQEANITLKVLMRKIEQEKNEFEEQISANILGLIEPYLEKLSKAGLDRRQNNYLQIIKDNLDNIVSPFVKHSVAMDLRLTPTEIQIASLIKQDRSSKEIAETLTLSKQTIDKHRNNIRKKLGITHKKINLKTLLQAKNKD